MFNSTGASFNVSGNQLTGALPVAWGAANVAFEKLILAKNLFTGESCSPALQQCLQSPP